MSVLLANWTGQGNETVDFGGAARDQLQFLLEDVPRTSDGAISHRVAEVQLWCVHFGSFNTLTYPFDYSDAGAILYTWYPLSWHTTAS
jgi:hypothetical protein